MPEDPDGKHDTDPLADTQTSEDPSSSSSSSSRVSTAARRSVRAGDALGGRYELVEEAGEGGMATVYRARDKELRREVAVKVLFPHLAKREEVVRRFHREARAAAGLEHANILRVYDVGGAEPERERDGFTPARGADDPPYIVMELIRGRSLLGEIEQRGPMLAEVVACIGALLADALAVAHKAGIIHRDIKPANVMIDGKGRVLLADFGVARLETEDSLVTKTGALLGTPAYMSPEQAAGDVATSKSDLYSLGATLYQLATGHLPYAGSPAKVMAQIAQGQLVSAVRRRAAVGPDLSRVIDRMMATEATARPASAADVAAELRAIAAAGGLGDPADELAAYFTDPDAFTKAKLPTVVSSLVTAANRAIADEKLPRAMALADRASALAPDDPAVNALIATITEGGRATRRRKILAIAGIGVVAAGGATFGAMQLLGDDSPAVVIASDAAADAIMNDTSVIDDAPARDDAAPDAVTTEIAVDAGIEVRRDASMVAMRRPDAGVRTDAGVAVLSIDASVAVPVAIDASIPSAPATGFIVVALDGAWCEISIDGKPTGQQARPRSKPIAVAAGPHTVVCAQSATGRSFTKDVDVAPGKTATVTGSVVGTVDVTLAVNATIDGIAYRKGQVAQIRATRLRVEVGGTGIWLTFARACTLRADPEVGCY